MIIDDDNACLFHEKIFLIRQQAIVVLQTLNSGQETLLSTEIAIHYQNMCDLFEHWLDMTKAKLSIEMTKGGNNRRVYVYGPVGVEKTPMPKFGGVTESMGEQMIERELIEDIESRLGMVGHNLGAIDERLKIIGVSTQDVERTRIDLGKAFKQWLTLRTKLQAAGVVSNVGG